MPDEPDSPDLAKPLATRAAFADEQALRQLLLLTRAMVAQLESMLGEESEDGE